MKKIGKKPTDDQMLEGGGAGAGKVSTNTPWLGNERVTGGRSAKDYKEKERTSEFSGEMGFGSPSGRDYGSGDRSPRTSDDYAKGGKVSSASARADGCCTKGKTKGRMV